MNTDKHGFRGSCLSVSICGSEVLKPFKFDAFLSEYFTLVPKGYFMPRVDLAPDGAPWWGEANLSEMVVVRDIATGNVVDPTEADPRAETELPSYAETIKQRYSSRVKPFLERYCFGCHRGNPAARLDFDPTQD